MRSSLSRSNFSIAARVVVLLLLLGVISHLWERPSAATSGSPQRDKPEAAPTRDAAITLKASTETARPGQRIGVVVNAPQFAAETNDALLLANGLPLARKALSPSGLATFEIDVPTTGPLLLGAELRDQINGTLITAVEDAALVNVAATASVLIVADTPSTFGQSLRQGGWPVIELRPSALPNQIDTLAATSLLVLDNVAADDLPSATWTKIENAVRREAMGLLVLGGSHAFGLGGYRESQLEDILPVVSEPPDDEPPASLMFLIDVSGSMDRPAATSNRLQIARQAVIETSRALRPVDHVGLITFDVAARERLPLQARAQHTTAIELSWPEAASGGTSLAPAMLSAIDALEQDDNEQKLLVVLTDGFVADDDLEQIEEALVETDVEVIALVIESKSPKRDKLMQLIEANNGRAIQIADVLQLPTLMRNEVEHKRPAVITGPTKLTAASHAAWLPNVDWPPIDQYLLTRPRDEAIVHLVSDRGDAIIASWNVGAGKVVAVTSGFSSWTPNWLRSDSWPAFAANLTRHLATRDSSQFDVSVLDGEDGGAMLVVDLAERQSVDPMVATLVSPSAAVSTVELELYGPGRLVTQLQLEEVGQYMVVLESNSGTSRHRFLSHQNLRNIEVDALAASSANKEWSWERWLIALALFGFLLLLWYERR